MQKLERLQKSKKAKKNPQVVNDYIASTQQKSGPAMMFATIDYPGCATSLNRAPCHRRPARPQPTGATALAHVAAAARRRRPRRSPRAGRRCCTRPAWPRRVTSLRTTPSSSQRRCRPGRRERSAGDLGAAPWRGHTARARRGPATARFRRISGFISAQEGLFAEEIRDFVLQQPECVAVEWVRGALAAPVGRTRGAAPEALW